jgi:excisionase family DNA binding protein
VSGKRLTPEQRTKPPTWTSADDMRLVGLREDNLPVTEIAALIGRSRQAVIQRWWRLTKQRRTVKDPYLSALEVARRMGVDENSVTRWLRKGVMEGQESAWPRGGQTAWRVLPSAVHAFIADERTWGLWWPNRLRDRDLLALARDVRRVRLLTTAEAARRLNYSTGYVTALAASGELPTIRGVHPLGGPAYYVREDILEEWGNARRAS